MCVRKSRAHSGKKPSNPPAQVHVRGVIHEPRLRCEKGTHQLAKTHYQRDKIIKNRASIITYTRHSRSERARWKRPHHQQSNFPKEAKVVLRWLTMDSSFKTSTPRPSWRAYADNLKQRVQIIMPSPLAFRTAVACPPSHERRKILPFWLVILWEKNIPSLQEAQKRLLS